MRGHRTCGYSAKLNKGKGSRGGRGMSGTGKRADQKKTLVIRLYGNKYFGKQGITSRKAKKKKIEVINLREIEKKFKDGQVDLSEHKILGDGEVKGKFIIKAKDASASAIEKIKKAGGEIILIKRKTEKKEGIKKEKIEGKKEDKTENLTKTEKEK